MRLNSTPGGLAGLPLPSAPGPFVSTPQSLNDLVSDPKERFSQHPLLSAVAAYQNQQSHPYGLYTPPEEEVIGTAMNTASAHIYPVHDETIRTRQQHPPSLTSRIPVAEDKTGSGSEIVSYLQIPSSINGSKGSLAAFAAQISCLFWFESASKLKMIEDGFSRHVPLPIPEAVASLGFQKWVTTMLATTQVSQNVILLALLFIYRLRISNPQVLGKRGSEFRLVTIGLMMGNKFLDDNTYTNKTWAEVAGISVPEVHVMEVEFLSNVRYNLFVSQKEWEQWHNKLGVFADYLDRVSRLSRCVETVPRTPIRRPSPYATPVSPNSNPPSHPEPTSRSMPPTTDYNTRYHPREQTKAQVFVPLYGGNAPPELIGSRGPSRKRGYDEERDEHPAKRLSIRNPAPGLTLSRPSASSTVGSHILPLEAAPPTRSIDLRTIAFPDSGLRVGTGPISNTFHLNNMPLQPPQSPSPAYRLPPAGPVPWSLPTSAPNIPASFTAFDAQRGYAGARSQDGHPMPSSTGVAPPFPTSHLNISPSVVYDRHSPYRPVIGVNTLLCTPPSASLLHPRNFSLDQIHYQPLSKAAREPKSGILPYKGNYPVLPNHPSAQTYSVPDSRRPFH